MKQLCVLSMFEPHSCLLFFCFANVFILVFFLSKRLYLPGSTYPGVLALRNVVPGVLTTKLTLRLERSRRSND